MLRKFQLKRRSIFTTLVASLAIFMEIFHGTFVKFALTNTHKKLHTNGGMSGFVTYSCGVISKSD